MLGEVRDGGITDVLVQDLAGELVRNDVTRCAPSLEREAGQPTLLVGLERP